VEIINANEEVCITMAEAHTSVQGGQMGCLIGRDLTEYDYVSVSESVFIPISVKPMISMTRLSGDGV
jgi:hypothetical protein